MNFASDPSRYRGCKKVRKSVALDELGTDIGRTCLTLSNGTHPLVIVPQSHEGKYSKCY